MRRVAPLGVLVLLLLTALPGRAAESFAAAELRRYASEHADTIDLQVVPADSETFSITPTGPRIGITASNDHVLLEAVYYLLDRAGCRFLAPEFEKGNEIVPKSLNFKLDAPITRSPKLKFRKIYVEEGRSHTPENLERIVEWMPKVGFNTLVVPADYQGHHNVMWDKFRDRITPACQKRGITIEVGGHGYQNFLNADMEEGELFEKHPEFFGQDESGARTKNRSRVLCTSNPAAVDYLINHFVAYVKARPEIQIYDFWPQDGAKWCACDACKRLGDPPDRQAILIGQVQERVKQASPNLRLEIIAYSAALNPPRKEKIDKNVLVDFCPINQQFDKQINDPSAAKNKDYADALLAWRKSFAGDISIYSYYRKYAWDSLPVIIPHYMQKDLQWYATVPVQGVSTYAEPGDWYTYELNHYVLAALAWDPECDVDAVLKKFCDARYGEFADQARTVLLTLEDIARNTCSIPNSLLKSADAIEADHGRATKLVDAMKTDADLARDPAIKRSLERLGVMCTYAQRDLEIQHLRASSADKDQIRAKANALQEFLQQHADDGVFVIKGQGRFFRRYGVADDKQGG